MIRRARLAAVLAIVLAGAITVIGSTQTWLAVALTDGSAEALEVPGASAVPVLAPLGLATLALGGALSIVGAILRYIFGAIGLAIAVILGSLSGRVALSAPVDAAAGTVTTATGIAGADAVGDLVASIAVTPWPAVTLVAQIVLAAASVFTLATAHAWRSGSGRRYRTAADAAPAGAAGSRPHDAIDSWDDLSRGDDPTA
jgi:hypothetical protein